MHKYLGLIILSIGMTLSVAETTYAESTGWIKGGQWRSAVKKINKQGKIVTAISCKDSGKIGLSFDSVLLKAEIRNNPQKTKWHWAGGRGRVKNVGLRVTKQGYKMVSHSSFTRKSGLRIDCAIWHKPA